jgi:hypothetical protein
VFPDVIEGVRRSIYQQRKTKDMQEYEISNPSDHVTLLAKEDSIARAAVLLLGRGAYGADRNGETILPLLLCIDESSLEAQLKEWGMFPLDAYLDNHRLEIAACLRTAMVGSGGVEARELLTSLSEWNDLKRTSLNDICGYAVVLADRLGKTSVESET